MDEKSSELRKGKGLSKKQREQRLALTIIIPIFLIVFGIVIFPVLYNFWLSVQEVTLGNLGQATPINALKWVFTLGRSGGLPKFVGLKNFITVAQDPRFLSAFATSLIYSISGVTLSILLGLYAALLVHRRMPARRVIRGIFLLPYIAPVVATAFIWRWVLNPVYGVGNWLAVQAGLIAEPVAWLSTRGLALFVAIIFQGWRYFPFIFLFVLARLQSIPEDLYEAARMDGASTFQQFFYVTLPQLKGVLATVFLLRFMWIFNKFGDIYLLNKGAAGTEVLPILVRQYSIEMEQFGQGAALSIYLFLILAVFIFFYFRWVMEEW
jgi:multiple sugar transport system permease protein